MILYKYIFLFIYQIYISADSLSKNESNIETILINKYKNIFFKEHVDNYIMYICGDDTKEFIYIITIDKNNYQIIKTEKKYNITIDKKINVIYSNPPKNLTNDYFKEMYCNNNYNLEDIKLFINEYWMENIEYYKFILNFFDKNIHIIFDKPSINNDLLLFMIQYKKLRMLLKQYYQQYYIN